MISISCTIFFIVGCLGQQNIDPSSSLNSITDGISNQIPVAESPQLPSGPALPPLPNIPLPIGLPGLPLPDNIITNIPSLLNGRPGLPQLPVGPPIITAPEVFERPCRTNDLGCIRRYFQQHSKCWPSSGKVPDPLLRIVTNLFYPRVNLTATDLNTKYRGFNNAKIQEFYINRDTDKLVIAIELRDLLRTTNDTFLRYHRRAKEPIITHGYTSIFFRSIVVTVVIPQVENLRLDKSDSFAYNTGSLPTVDVGPSLGQSSDPMVAMRFQALLSDLATDVTEYFLTESSFLGATYIQYAICDFGLEVI